MATKADVVAKLKELEIEHDARSKKEDLVSLLPEEIQSDFASDEKSADTVQARVLRDFWPTEDEMDRVTAGSIIEITKDEMIEGLESGIFERVK